MTIRIGTRGSLLALWQAEYIQQKLEAAGVHTEIKIIETKGDKILDRSLAKIGSKGVFTEEIEEQLLSGDIDIAIHSAKDLQSDLGEKFKIIAFTERENPCDVLISHKLNLEIPSKITIGTSSTRRVALLKAYYPDFRIVEMRGNLQTRIKKMENGECDALMLAFAGVNRMKYNSKIVYKFDIKTIVPPVGQGTVAIETAIFLDKNKQKKIRAICNNIETEQCLLAERAFLKKLQGGCSIPVFGNAYIINNKLNLLAGIISLDGKDEIQETMVQTDETPEELGNKMAELILARGGKKILDEIKLNLNK